MRGGVTDIICALRPKNSGENTAILAEPCAKQCIVHHREKLTYTEKYFGGKKLCQLLKQLGVSVVCVERWVYAVHGIWCAYCEHVRTVYVRCWDGYNWQIE